MVQAILTITVDSKKVENMLNGYQRTLPEAADKAARKIASMYAEFYLQQMPLATGMTGRGIQPWTGQSFSKLMGQVASPVKLGKGSYGVAVDKSLIMLDSMRPHYISLKRGRKITQWAKDTLYPKLGYLPPAIIVRPHPWIRSANIKAGKNVRKMAEFEIDKAIRNKGR